MPDLLFLQRFQAASMPNLPANAFFTPAHSSRSILYATVSRSVPSLRILWQRSTPSFFAPKRSIAACERVFRLSVSQHTTRQPSVSMACDSSSYLQVVLMRVRHADWQYQV